MTSPALPADLRAALEAKLEGLSRQDIAARAALISKTYRDGGSSITSSRPRADALAYALVRMPATYAAASACLNALLETRPDFAPTSLLDVGAGPGTASWAAAETFSSLRRLHAARYQRRLADTGAGSQRASHRAARRNDLPPRRKCARRSRARRSRDRQLPDRRSQRGRKAYARRTPVGQDPRYAAGRRARHAGRLRADHRASRATDRGRRPCRRALPA